MCGIVGVISPRKEDSSEGVLRHMAETLIHRGPDDEGYLVSQDPAGRWIGLGHRRLAILDCSEGGRQPLFNEDRSVAVIFNGEIYNFQDLRRRLESRGHRFFSRTDTEVLVHLYEEKGVQLVEDLVGMFAFAIWDSRNGRLMLARDRLGQKPLFYYNDGETFIFASEAKAIIRHPGVKVEANQEAIPYYLVYQYIPAPLSGFKGILKVPAAHVLIFENSIVQTRRYWDVDFGEKLHLSEEEWCSKVLNCLREAVHSQLVSDVPLGAFLSGGVDSSAVVALMARGTQDQVRTFSIGFAEKEFDELKYARKMAERYSTEHKELVVRPEAAAILPKLAWLHDEPFADSSSLPTYYVAQVTRDHVTVALNGDAGDENFGGYDRYVAMRISVGLDRLPLGLRKSLARGTRKFAFGARGAFVRSAARVGDIADAVPPEKYLRLMCHFNREMLQQMCEPDFFAEVQKVNPYHYLLDIWTRYRGHDLYGRLMYVDLHSYLPQDLLVKVDRASMAHSLEARSPFLDHRVVELAASIPSEMKIRGLKKKYILKKALLGMVPEEILNRPKKGFGLPIDHWFRGELAGLVRDLLLSSTFRQRGYFRPEAVARLVEEHTSGRRDWRYQLWNLTMLELWWRTFFK